MKDQYLSPEMYVIALAERSGLCQMASDPEAFGGGEEERWNSIGL